MTTTRKAVLVLLLIIGLACAALAAPPLTGTAHGASVTNGGQR